MEGVKNKAKELGMSAEPGPPVAGFVDKNADDLYKIDENGNEIKPAAEENAQICDIALEDGEFEIERT